jgi:hypothetical protein
MEDNIMEAERWRQVDQLLRTALENDPGERAAFLGRACGSDQELRREVEALLEAHQQATSFLDTPALQVVAEGMAQPPARSFVGQQFGFYQILSLLGNRGNG